MLNDRINYKNLDLFHLLSCSKKFLISSFSISPSRCLLLPQDIFFFSFSSLLPIKDVQENFIGCRSGAVHASVVAAEKSLSKYGKMVKWCSILGNWFFDNFTFNKIFENFVVRFQNQPPFRKISILPLSPFTFYTLEKIAIYDETWWG